MPPSLVTAGHKGDKNVIIQEKGFCKLAKGLLQLEQSDYGSRENGPIIRFASISKVGQKRVLLS